MKDGIFVGLGSNMGNSLANCQKAITALNSHTDIQVLKVSDFYQTKAVGPEQPDFVNAVVELATFLAPLDLLDVLQATEQQFNRVRTIHWGPRTLDCDLLYYQHKVVNQPRLQLPHPEICQRAFVLVPLAQIAPTWCHTTGESIQLLIENVKDQDIQALTAV